MTKPKKKNKNKKMIPLYPNISSLLDTETKQKFRNLKSKTSGPMEDTRS